jgi:putative MFS transporter
MVYAYTPELYPTEMRGLGNGTSGAGGKVSRNLSRPISPAL